MNKGIKRTLFLYFDTISETNIGAWDIFSAMHSKTGIKTMPSTLLQYAREYADISGASFKCIDCEKSIYHFIPGIKISDAILGGVE